MRIRLQSIGVLLACLACALPGRAQQIGTLAPAAYQTVLDINGNPVSGAKICTYVAGTTTPATTYSDVTLMTANANPLRADASGRWVAWLPSGTAFKFVFQDATGTIGLCDGAIIKTVDNVAATPTSSPSVDLTGLAGENLPAGSVVYLSDGSGGKTVGQWYLADADFPYASSAAGTVGLTVATIASGSQGSIRIAGEVTVSATLTIGAPYYASATAGALTLTAPANSRLIGQASGINTIILGIPAPVLNTNNGTNCFRLTLTSGTAVTTADVLAATTIYATPKGCNRLSLFDSVGSATTYTSAEFSIAVPATTSTMYDVYAYSNAGVPTLELLAWTNDTTRATAIVLTTTGSYTKSGDLTRRYLGSVRTTTVSGQTEDSAAKRLLWNYYNRVRRGLRVIDPAGAWTYSTAAFRQANANAANQVAVVVGVSESWIELTALHSATNGAAAPGVFVATAIGLDGIGSLVPSEQIGIGNALTGSYATLTASIRYPQAAGYHFYVWMEWSGATPTTTWNGTVAVAPFQTSGLNGSVEN